MILISINSLSQLSMFEPLTQRLLAFYSNIVFIAYDCDLSQRNIIRKSAENLSIRFDAQQPLTDTHLKLEDSDINLNINYFNWFSKLGHLFKNKNYKQVSKNLNFRKKEYRENFTKELLAAKYILNKYNPKVLLVAEDGVSANCYLIQQAKSRKILVVTIPYELSGKEDFVNLVADKHKEGKAINFDPEHSLYHNFLAKHYKKWILNLKNSLFLLYPIELIIARLELNLDLPNPWTTHGGNADMLAVESKAMLSHYLSEDVEETKLKLVGSVYADVVAENLAIDPKFMQAYINKTKISSGKTSVLVSLSPSYHGTRKQNEFSSYEDMLRQMFKVFKDLNLDLTISVHPAIGSKELAFIKSQGIELSTDWILSLIPKHDIFFVNSFSSTIRWAFASGKPVVHYDAYQHNLKVYEKVPNFYNFTKLAEIKKQLESLKNDKYYKQVAENLAIIREDWGILDGANTLKIYKLFENYL